AGVAEVNAGFLVLRAFGLAGKPATPVDLPVAARAAPRVAVVGAGKATAAMAWAVERALPADEFDSTRLTGWVNVPDATVRPLPRIYVHGARKLPDNRPTEDGVDGSRRILGIARSLAADDLLIVLLSGGGSALLPLPAEDV